MTIHLDISQLALDPRRSGIQRAERELIRHWPGPEPLQPCRYDPAAHALVDLDRSVLKVLCEDAPPGGMAVEVRRLEPHLRPLGISSPTRLLNAELFLDPGRARYYRALPPGCRPYWLVYDFLPWLHPDWFTPGSAMRLMPYLQALRHIPDVAYISARTRDDHRDRILRGPCDGPVIPMGADGLKLERQTFDPAHHTFVMLGTIEPRKNAASVMRAFQALWRDGVAADLVMIGTVATDAADELALLAKLAGAPRFHLMRHASDADVREALRTARAMMFPSEGEGFGIPPMEALHAGIPVIVASGLPALAGQDAAGQVRLNVVNPDTIAAAVRTVLDDTQAALLWTAAASLRLPGWAAFAHDTASWVQG